MNKKQIHSTFWGLLLSSALVAQPGTLDPAFGINGSILVPVGAGDDLVHAAVQQPDGMIVAAGWSHNGSNFDFALIRFRDDGFPDNSFSTDGKCTVSFGTFDDNATAIAIQPDGRIVVAGWTFNGSDLDFALSRIHTDGALDSTFGQGGKLTTDLGGTDYAASVVVQADGKIVVAGHHVAAFSAPDFVLARYHPDGTLDTAFGLAGFLTTDFDQNNDFGAAVALQPDGKIIVAGLAVVGANYEFALARYHSDGSPDEAFGNQGKCTTDISPSDDKGISMLVLPDGKILLGGFLHNGAGFDFALVRYLSNGTPDQSFGTNGRVVTDFYGKDDLIASIALQPDGKILAAGRSSNGSHYNFAMARYTTDGSLDGGFGDSGRVVTPLGHGFNSAFSVLLRPGGKIVLTGHAFNGENLDFALARYEAGAVVSAGDPVAQRMTATVFPNPARQFATLEFALSTSAAVSIQLHGALGNLIDRIETNLPLNAGTHTHTIRLPDSLPPGVYCISIDNGIEQVTMWLVIASS